MVVCCSAVLSSTFHFKLRYTVAGTFHLILWSHPVCQKAADIVNDKQSRIPTVVKVPALFLEFDSLSWQAFVCRVE